MLQINEKDLTREGIDRLDDAGLCEQLSQLLGPATRNRIEGELYRRHHGSLVRGLVARTGISVEDAEEIADDAVLHLLTKPERFNRSKGTVGGLLWTVAWRDARNFQDQLRRQGEESGGRDEKRRDGRDADSSVPKWLTQGLRLWQVIRRVRAAQGALPARLREVSSMAAHGLPSVEIARLLGIRPGAVRTALSDARKRMRSQLDI